MNHRCFASVRVARRLSSLAACGLWLLSAGCGDDGLGQRYPVSGKVTYKDEPLARGRINFMPEDPAGRAAAGDITDGSYQLTTQTSNDGAFPGKYKITVVALAVDDSKVRENAKGGVGNQMDVIKATRSAKPLIPPKYQVVDTSGLSAEVKQESNTFDFKLVD
jgi:hypothetical protein